MNQDVGSPSVTFLNRPFYLVRDVMAFAHGNVAVYFHVKIDIKAQAHLPDEIFFDLNYPWDSSRSAAHTIDNFSTRGGIHNLGQSWAQ